MSWLLFNVLSGIIIFLAALFLKFHLFEPCDGELIDNKWSWKLKRVQFPLWELILVSMVCCCPIINWMVLSIQLVYILFSIQDKEYIFSIINLDNVYIDIYNEKETINKLIEQWALTHKFQYELYKTIKSIFTFSVV